MSEADPNAEALRSLLKGPLPASAISVATGWSPRSAGPKLHALAKQGLVRSRQEPGEDGKERTVWVLSRKGAEIVAPAALAAQPAAAALPDQPPVAETHADDAGDARMAVADVAVAETVTSPPPATDEDPPVDGHDSVEGPWPELGRRPGGVNPDVSASTSLMGWIFVLRAAHTGASSYSIGERRTIESHLSALERQLDVVWKFGRYETPDGQTITPGKIEYLQQHRTGTFAHPARRH